MRERTEKLIAYAIENGYDVEIISGKRTQQEQEALRKKYANQPGRVAKRSAHVEGLAIDIRVYKNGTRDQKGYALLGDYAKSNLGMRWGGDFKTFREDWHFDYNWA
jgi:peptidoglycan L-alanyl-D-glutamate endopeptidase CwlK